MTALNKYAELREELSNPANGSNHHLRKLALSLLDELEAAEKRIAELERSETQIINERDDTESALNDAYKAVMGQTPEWSNWFSFADAIDEIELACRLWRNQTEDVIQFRQRIAELEARDINIKRQAQALFEAIANPNDCYIPAYVRCLREALSGNSAGIGVKGE